MTSTPGNSTPMTEQGHTPTPWLLDGGCIYVLDDTGRTNRFSASVQGGLVYMSHSRDTKSQRTPQSELDANAEFIVRAVNAHDDLLAALKLARPKVASWNGTNDLLAQIDAAIAKATQP